jgi:hypothetical protein
MGCGQVRATATSKPCMDGMVTPLRGQTQHAGRIYSSWFPLVVAAHPVANVAFFSVKAFAALLVLLSALWAVAPAFGQSVERKALVALCDPAKIATLKSDRAANPRIRKITYWLEVTRMNGNSPAAEMHAVMEALGWDGTLKGQLTAAAMTRNRTIAERLGCLDAEGMALLRRGNAPT